MTGNSDKEFGDPGESPAPADIPPTEGDPLYRPLRGWASAYDAEPSLWSRFTSGFGRLFSKRAGVTAPDEIHQVADAARELEEENADFSTTLREDPAFFVPGTHSEEAASGPESPVEPEPVDAEDDGEEREESESVPPPATVRNYELRGGDDVADLPVMREYQFHSAGDDEPHQDPADSIPARSLLDDQPVAEKKPGLFARLFARRNPEPVEVPPAEPDLEPVAEVFSDTATEPGVDTVSASAPETPVRLDRPSLEFFMRVDRAPETPSDVPVVPSLEDALPMEAAPEFVEPAAESVLDAPQLHRPSPSWTPVIPPPHEDEQPGFFSRLFGRKSKSLPIEPPSVFDAWDELPPATEADAREAAEPEWSAPQPDANALEAAEEALTSFAEPASEPVADPFATVEDALPPSADFSHFAPAAPVEPAADPFATTLPTEKEESFDTLQMEPIVPPPVALGAASTIEIQALEDEDTDTGSMVPPTPPEVTAAQEAERPPFFVPKFRAFYNEIVSHKHQKAEFTAGFATAVMDYSADLSPDAAAAALSKRLREILELQAAEATWMGGEAAARFPDAQYAMAALADEVFTYLDWPGKEGWPRHLIEQQLFRSNAKDIEFFKRVDKLLKNEASSPSPAAKDLARMYLLVLAAGFQGKYRPFGLTRALAEYRRRLYEFISQKDPLLLFGEQRKLFPEAAEHVVVGRAVSRFSMLQQWAAVLVILLLGYAVISQVAWNRVSADLKDVTARVEAANSTATSDGVSGDPR